MRLSDPCQIPSSSSLLFVLPERSEWEKERERERERALPWNCDSFAWKSSRYVCSSPSLPRAQKLQNVTRFGRTKLRGSATGWASIQKSDLNKKSGQTSFVILSVWSSLSCWAWCRGPMRESSISPNFTKPHWIALKLGESPNEGTVKRENRDTILKGAVAEQVILTQISLQKELPFKLLAAIWATSINL